MANPVLTRVWEHSTLRGAARCVILLLADVADHRGIAYPGKAHIAKMIRESEDYTDKLIDKVIESGEVYRIAGRGRGHVTRFAVLVGLSEQQQTALKEVLQDPFSIPQKGHTTTPIKSDKRGKEIAIKGVKYRDKRGTILDTNNRTNGASEPRELPITKNEILHDPRSDPPPPALNAGSSNGGGGDSYETEVRALLGGYNILAAAKIATQYAALDTRPPLDEIRAAVLSMANPSEPNTPNRIARRLMASPPPWPDVRAVTKSAPLQATRPNIPETTVSPAEMVRQLRQHRESS